MNKPSARKHDSTATERSLRRLARIRDRGGKVVAIRLGAGALAHLDALQRKHGCTRQDVIEGLLVGNITPNPDGLGPAERALGVAL